MNKYTITTLLLLVISSVSAQDSLRLTFKLDGFKTKDRLAIIIDQRAYRIDTDKPTFQLASSLSEPVMAQVRYKNRAQTFWLENGEISVLIPKRGFIGGVKVSGSSSQSLWEEILKAPKEERAKLLEANINTKMAQAYLASSSNRLLPEDQERLLEMSDSKTNDLAKYDLLMAYDLSNRLKVGDHMMDFTASTIDGQVTSTEDLRGEYILLDFAGTNCGWCWVEYPEMSRSLVKYKNLQTFTFNLDFRHATWQKIAAQRDISLPWPVLWKAENKQEIIDRYGINVLPTYYLISPDGIILERWQAGKAEKLIRKLEQHNVN